MLGAGRMTRGQRLGVTLWRLERITARAQLGGSARAQLGGSAPQGRASEAIGASASRRRGLRRAAGRGDPRAADRRSRIAPARRSAGRRCRGGAKRESPARANVRGLVVGPALASGLVGVAPRFRRRLRLRNRRGRKCPSRAGIRGSIPTPTISGLRSAPTLRAARSSGRVALSWRVRSRRASRHRSTGSTKPVPPTF